MEMFPSDEEEAVALSLLEFHGGSTKLTFPAKALIITTLIHSLIVGEKDSRKEAAIALKTLLVGQQGEGEFHGFMMLSSSAKELVKTTIIHSLTIEEDPEILGFVINMTSVVAMCLASTPEPAEIWPELREFIMAAAGDDRLGALRILESFDTTFPLARFLNMERFKNEVFLPILAEPFDMIKPILFKGLKLPFLRVASFEGFLTYLHSGAPSEDLKASIFHILSSAIEAEEVDLVLSALGHICGLVQCTAVFNGHLDKIIQMAIRVILSPHICHLSKIKAMDILTWLPDVVLPDEKINGLWKQYGNVLNKEWSNSEMSIIQKFLLLLSRGPSH